MASQRAHVTNRRRWTAICLPNERRLTTAVVIPRCRPDRKHQDLASVPAAGSLRSEVSVSKRFVYVLKNAEVPPRYYTGVTSHVATRHADHNAGRCTHTAKHRPWSLDVVIEFADERRAIALERYLKSGSGVAFAHRHLR